MVDYSSLENYRTERYRGFESLSLRKKDVRCSGVFFLIILCLYRFVTIKYTSMNLSPVLLFCCLVSFALWGVITLETGNMLVTPKFLGVVHTYTLDSNG